ncbi:hypothetical protein HPB50_000211 [Hyalomma asiaticum]|uniref:Uncharacterized protein n=1 Tax=Hyalomma asiaticum TaxID=266040 RepID=A0ACB7RQU8_HYAAI|nr:hypothetical protein HPB50_000211 [Hyalomma asiaticum]
MFPRNVVRAVAVSALRGAQLETTQILPREKNVQEKTLKLLKEIKLKLDTLENAVESLQNSTEPNHTAADPIDGAMLSLLPLAIDSDLEELEQYLQTPKNRTDLVAHFSRLGGSSLQDALRQLMRRYMADTLAQEFSLTGRKGKRPFNTLQLLQVITGKII